MSFTIKDLNDAWYEYNTLKPHTNNIRFGQFLENNYCIESGDSYYIEDDNEVYQLIFDALGGD